MSLAYSRKQRRQMSRPYLRIRPRTLWQTRLRRAREGDRDQAFGGGVPADPPRGNVACSAGQGAPVARAGRVLLGMDAPDVRHAARMRGGITQRGGGAQGSEGGAAQRRARRGVRSVGPASGAGRTRGVLRASSSLGTHKAGGRCAPGRQGDACGATRHLAERRRRKKNPTRAAQLVGHFFTLLLRGRAP